MGRKPGYHHSDATKAKIAAKLVRKAAPAVSTQPQKVESPTNGNSASPAAADPLSALAAGPVKDVIALMLWKHRHSDPEMAVQLTEHDMRGLSDCAKYLGVTPDVRIVKSPVRQVVVVALVDRGTENAIRPVENNETDYAAAQEAKDFQRARESALRLAAQIQQDVATGNFSSSTFTEAAQCLVALAK